MILYVFLQPNALRRVCNTGPRHMTLNEQPAATMPVANACLLSKYFAMMTRADANTKLVPRPKSAL